MKSIEHRFIHKASVFPLIPILFWTASLGSRFCRPSALPPCSRRRRGDPVFFHSSPYPVYNNKIFLQPICRPSTLNAGVLPFLCHVMHMLGPVSILRRFLGQVLYALEGRKKKYLLRPSGFTLAQIIITCHN